MLDWKIDDILHRRHAKGYVPKNLTNDRCECCAERLWNDETGKCYWCKNDGCRKWHEYTTNPNIG